MSYQVLARKWRPQKFSELVGQEHVVTAISNALDNNKLHHAYLFTGTRGVGKTTIARIFSKSLNCESGQGANPCGVCNACMDIDQGRYVDLLEIDAASRTKVEDTRELLDNVQYKPTRGRFKVYLIDEVHMLSKHSFNALLKTLEEPPPHVKFLLATTDPQKLPITILSRCLQFSLKALTREQIHNQLKHVLNEERIPSDDAALSQLSRAAQGSMRDALSLTDQAIAQGNNQVDQATVVSMLGLLDKNQVLKLAKSIIEKDASVAMQQLDDICMHAPDYAQVISELLSLFHQISLTQIVPEVCKIETISAKAIYQLSKAVTAEHIQLLYQIALQGKKDLPFAPDALTGLQMTLMRLLAFSPQTKVELDINEAHTTALEKQTFPAFDVTHLQDSVAVSQDSEHKHANHTNIAQVENTPEVDTPEEDSFPAGKSEQQEEQAIVKLDEANEFDQQMMAMSQSDESSMYDEMRDIEVQASGFQDHAKALIETYQSDANQSANAGPQGVESINALLDLQADAELVQAQQPPPVEKKRDDNILDRFMGDDVTAGVASDDDVLPEISVPADVIKPQSEPSNDLIDENDKPPFELDGEHQANTTDGTDEIIAQGSAKESAQETSVHQGVNEFDNNDDVSCAPSIPNITAKAADIDVEAYLENGDKLLKAEQIDAWSKMVEALSMLNVKGLNKQLLLKSNLMSTGETVTIKLCLHEQHLNEPLSQQSIVEALCEYYGKTVKLNLEIGEVIDTPEQIQKAIDNMRQSHAEKIVHTDETIQEIIKAFDGRIVSGSIVPT